MTILEQIEQDYVNASKAGDKQVVDTLRLLKSELKNLEIAKRSALSDEDVTAVIAKEIKKRKEAEELYKTGGREELSAKEFAEAQVLSSYLPAQATDAEIRQKVLDVLAELESPDFGLAMGKVMSELKGKADGAVVSKIVKEELDLKK